MRHLLKLAAALEAAKNKPVAPVQPKFPPLGLSLEEAAVLADEADNEIEKTNTDIEQAERLLEVSDAMEDMAGIVGDAELTPTEAALVNNAAQMAVAGTECEPEEFVPAMEAKGRLSLENMKEEVAQLWSAVQGNMDSIWEKIDSFFYKLVGNVPSIRQNLDEKVKALEAAMSEANLPEGAAVDIKVGLKVLSTSAGAVSNGEDLKKALADLEAAIKWALGDRIKEVIADGEKLKEAITNFSLDKPEEFVNTVISVAAQGGEIPGGQPDKEERFPNFDVKVGPELLGGVALLSKVGTEEGEDLKVKLERALASDWSLASAKLQEHSGPTEGKFTLPTKEEITEIATLVTSILDEIEGFTRGTDVKELTKVGKELANTTPTQAAEWEELSDEQRDFQRLSAGVSIAFAKWAKEPATELIQHATDVCEAVVMVLGKSVEGFTKPAVATEDDQSAQGSSGDQGDNKGGDTPAAAPAADDKPAPSDQKPADDAGKGDDKPAPKAE